MEITRSRRSLLLSATILFAVSGCAPKTSSPSGDVPAPPIASLMHGFWSGTANKSPLGVQPYAIEFRAEGADVVGETPSSIGDEVLSPGAYQRFTFTGGANATRLEYRTAMGSQGILEGTLELAADRSEPHRRIFCEPNACERFELRWAATGQKTMSFQVWVEAKLHADIALTFDGDP